MDTVAITAVNLGDFAVFQNDFHHPGAVQLAAVAGKEFLHFHLQVLRDAEAAAADDQLIPGDHLHVHAEVQTVGGDGPGVAAAVAVDPEGTALVGTGKANVLVSCFEELDVAQTQGLKFFAQLTQPQEMGHKLGILPAPGIGTAVEGIPVAFHAGFVAVIEAGAAGEGVLQEGCHQKTVVGHVEGIPGQAALGFLFPAAVEIVHQSCEDPGSIVGAQQVHVAVDNLLGIVLHNGHDGVLQTLAAVEATDKVDDGRAEGIVHDGVQLRVGEVSPAAVVSGLVGGILPNFSQHIGIGIDLLDPVVKELDELVRQLVSHIQTEAVNALLQPEGDDAVFAGDDEIHKGRIHLVDSGQGIKAPPGVVDMGPAVEGEPAVVGRLLGIEGADAVKLAFPVEVGAVGAGVGVHAVQDHPDAPGMGGVHHFTEILQSAQHGVGNHVIAGVVTVAGEALGNGV